MEAPLLCEGSEISSAAAAELTLECAECIARHKSPAIAAVIISPSADADGVPMEKLPLRAETS